MAERLCGMANAQGGFIIIGIEDSSLKIVGVPDNRIALTIDVRNPIALREGLAPGFGSDA
jgi:predicted HTH transcriptional regulator